METKTETIRSQALTLGLSNTRSQLDTLLHTAEQRDMTHMEFLEYLLNEEIRCRLDKAKERRLREACFPYEKRLKDFDIGFSASLTAKNLRQLGELKWIEQVYNLIFLGPPGVGKTHLALGLGYQAAEEGYKVSFVTMAGLIQLLKTEEISRKSKLRLNRIYSSAVVIIDEIGYLPIDHKEASLFFHLISGLHEQSSIILTSNKGFEDWPELFGDTEMVTAALDRLMHHCDVIRMDGKSYRLEHRKTFLEKLIESTALSMAKNVVLLLAIYKIYLFPQKCLSFSCPPPHSKGFLAVGFLYYLCSCRYNC